MSMHLQVNIEEDKELRDYLKQYMKGVVTSISREEVDGLITEAVLKKVDNMSMRDVRGALSENKSIDFFKMLREKVDEVTEDGLARIIEGQVLEARSTSNREIRSMIRTELEAVKNELQDSFISGLKNIGS